MASIAAGLMLIGCSEKDTDGESLQLINDQLVPVSLFVEDEDNNTPTADETLLFETRAHAPVVDREGNQLNWGQFKSVDGSVKVVGKANGTQVNLQLEGLIPNGLYTIWNVTFKSPGFSTGEDNLIGVGVVGLADGSESYFRADAEGKATFSAFTEPGNLSYMGQIARHPFKEEFEWHVVGLYHMDDKTHGPELGPDGTMVEQFAFVFKADSNL